MHEGAYIKKFFLRLPMPDVLTYKIPKLPKLGGKT